MQYVELHARSSFSFLEGASLPEVLMARAAALNMPAMALLDRNGLYGAPRFHTAAKKLGLRAHIGAEIAVADAGQRLQPPRHLPHQFLAEPARFPVLATSRTGYQNLCRLISAYKLRAGKKSEGAALFRDVEQHHEGLVCLTGGDEGPLATALARGGIEAGKKEVGRLVAIFGPQNVYVEVQRHFDREEEWRNRAAIDIARSLQLPLLATNGVSYATSNEREILDLLTSIRHKTTLDEAGRLLAVNSERHLRSAREMTELFYDYPEAIHNTVALSSRLAFEMDDLGYEFPRYSVPDGETMDSFLRKRTEEGVRSRYLPKNDSALFARAQKQSERELRLIQQLGLAGYFLIVWDVVEFCKNNGILVQGRGSAANSVVCYALGITAVDPVGMNLLFERFLSEERGEWPDIDLDLPSGDKREQAIQYVYRRYGELGAAMCANVITYRSKSAARETGKALGIDRETLNRVSGQIGSFEFKDPKDTLERRFRAAGLNLHHERIRKLVELTSRLRDIPRHLGQHSGGMIICQGQLNSVVPLEHASMPGRVVLQWDKEDCADMKMIKVDFLGLGTMSAMSDCLDLVPRHYGIPLDYAQLPQDDAVYRMLQEADTIGLFQVESPAQMSALRRNFPEIFYDLVVQVALIRPGPIVGKMANPYMLRRRGKQQVTYPHPLLILVLERTLGVPLFQEQLIRIAMVIANFTGGEAEELRRAMGMRRSRDKMYQLEKKLRAGMTANGVNMDAQEQIIQSISSFALYGFPESHAASFALLAYATAYLKHRYLAAFLCALLNNQPMGFYHPATLVKDAQRHGLKVRHIDVQHSDWKCTLERLAVDEAPKYKDPFAMRMGLVYAKGLRRVAGDAITRARADGKFTSVYDLARRVPKLRRQELVMLAQIGALNSLGENIHRRDAVWQAEYAGRPAGELFKDVPEEQENWKSTPLFKMTTEERLSADYRGTGLTVGPHPMAYHRKRLEVSGVTSASNLSRIPNGQSARIAGFVISRQRPGTAKGFFFLSIEDETGVSRAIFEPDLFDQHEALLSVGKFLEVKGILQNQDHDISLKAFDVLPLAVNAVPTQSHDFH
jgi:error-prone DNA polymerase